MHPLRIACRSITLQGVTDAVSEPYALGGVVAEARSPFPGWSDNPVTSVPEITRMIARIEDWKGQGPVLGRAEAARRLEEAHKLLEEIADMLTHMRRELLG